LLQDLVPDDLTAKRKNSVFRSSLDGVPVMLARTGYTGEDGFEVFCSPADAPAAWDAVLAAGAVPAGLGARDTLRLEAGFPLYGHELSDDRSPLETPFTWVVKPEKDFFGRDAMLARPVAERLVGLTVEGRGIPRDGYAVLDSGRPVGVVTSGTMSPSLKVGIALAYVAAEAAEPGRRLSLDVRGNQVPVVVGPAGFLARSQG
ncbi:MAG TPA: glycine cleavage T C-terminal barrel domain-containing protein, partial [Deinococcales bacterium]|nr:glycine cleavage T C-terminal barrel domain-containing protein [Deinococcales bacterium]